MSTTNWIVRAGMALCLVSGSALINGQQVFAEENEGEHDEIAGWFNNVDGNKDGKISKEEAGAMTKGGHTALAEEQRTAMDSDKDGFVTLTEMRNYCAAEAKKREAEEKRREKEADEDREGEHHEGAGDDDDEDEHEDGDEEGDDDEGEEDDD